MRRETIFVIGREKRDRNNNLIAGGEDRKLTGVVIWPRASEEKDGGEVNIDGQNLRCPDNALARTIAADMRLRIRGEVHMVDEPPARYIGKAIMIKTKRVTT